MAFCRWAKSMFRARWAEGITDRSASGGASKLLFVSGERQEIRIVQPKIAAWKMREWEAELFASAQDAPNWKLADKARRLLMDLNYRLSQLMPEPEAERPAEIPPLIAKQVAVSSLSSITIRACGSAMALIACGYVSESGGPARRGLEAKLRARAILDDDSGQHARDWLTRPMQGWKKLAERYGNARDLELLSVFAHADARGLIPLHAGPPGGYGEGEVRETNIDLRPRRDDPTAGRMLSALASEAIEMCGALVEPFGIAFEMPPWVKSEFDRLQKEADEHRRLAAGTKRYPPPRSRRRPKR